MNYRYINYISKKLIGTKKGMGRYRKLKLLDYCKKASAEPQEHDIWDNIIRHWNVVLGGFFLILFIYFLYSRFLLVIYFIHISVYMSIPISQFIPPPPPPLLSPLGVHMFVLFFCVSFCPANRFIHTIFLDSTYMC